MMQSADTRSPLLSGILTKADQTSMLKSPEVGVPFLDMERV
jgi:hypothetical protein